MRFTRESDNTGYKEFFDQNVFLRSFTYSRTLLIGSSIDEGPDRTMRTTEVFSRISNTNNGVKRFRKFDFP